MASYQKPHVEKNHEYIRYIIPKGKSFDNRTQEDITVSVKILASFIQAKIVIKYPYKDFRNLFIWILKFFLFFNF